MCSVVGLATLVAGGLLVPPAAAVPSAGTTNAAGQGATSDPGRLATSLQTAAGTWASVPMGHLGTRLGTFWQLLYRPRGGRRWTDVVSALGVATNGGLVIAGSGPDGLLAAVGPSNLLRFSPVAATTGDGRSWSVRAPLAGAVSALADAGTGALALSDAAGGGRLLATSGPTKRWHPLATAGSLARSVGGRSCQPVALTVVAYDPSGTPLVGAACRRPGVVGILADEGGTWRSVGPSLAAGQWAEGVSVLRLQAAGGTLVALLELRGPLGSGLVAARSGPHGAWRLSAPTRLGAGDRVVSAGPAGPEGQFVLLRTPAGAERLLVSGPRLSWSSLPRPPPTTATVAFGPSGAADVLAVSGSVMTNWALQPAGTRWRRAGALHVGILYGSSA